MKKLPIIIFLAFIFGVSYSQERVIIQKDSNVYNIEVEKVPKTYKKYRKYNHKKFLKKSTYYVASKTGKVFHRPDCKFAKRIKKKVILKNRKEAILKNLKPCKYCKP